jgi:hypothetical protein
MREYYDYVKQVTAIHNEAVRRLVDFEDTNLLELAELFEDAANHYYDISERIREQFILKEIHSLTPLAPQPIAPLSATTISEEATED